MENIYANICCVVAEVFPYVAYQEHSTSIRSTLNDDPIMSPCGAPTQL